MLQVNAKMGLRVNKVASICMISCTNVTATRATISTVTDITASVRRYGVMPSNLELPTCCSLVFCLQIEQLILLARFCHFSANLPCFAACGLNINILKESFLKDWIERKTFYFCFSSV